MKDVRRSSWRAQCVALTMMASAGACADESQPTGPGPLAAGPEAVAAEAPSAALILNQTTPVTVMAGGSSLEFIPYTHRTPTIGDVADPINLILVGDADPRELRARLMFLDGDRSGLGLPPVPFLGCTWTDAIGGTQAAYAPGFGWSGSAIQLQCGEYESIRFHLRLFDFGAWTLANAHLDVRIPGTTDHDVISWEFAELIAWFDFLRLGATPGVSGVITEAPTYRSVLAPVFAGLPADLKGLLLLTGSTDGSGNLLNDGVARILEVPPMDVDQTGAQVSRQTVEIDFDQTIPRPFCNGGGTEFLEVTGPVTLDQTVVYSPSGNLTSHYHAKGHLDIVLIDGLTGARSEPFRAMVNQHGRAVFNDAGSSVTDIQLRMEIRPGGGERGQLQLNVRIGANGVASVDGSASCKG